MSDNKISDVGAHVISKLISKCDTLNEIYLANNDIDNEGAKSLAAVLKGK